MNIGTDFLDHFSLSYLIPFPVLILEPAIGVVIIGAVLLRLLLLAVRNVVVLGEDDIRHQF